MGRGGERRGGIGGTTVSTPVSCKCYDMESRVIYKFLHTLLVIII